MKTKIKALAIAITMITGLTMVAVPTSTIAAADTCTWTGATNGNWATGSNWTGCDNGGVPENGDALIFPASAANRTNTNNIGALSVTSITFNDTYTISGSQLTIGGTLSSTGAAVSITNNIVLSANSAFNTSGVGGFDVQGTLNMSTFNLTLGTAGSSTAIHGVVSGTGNIIKNGTSLISFYGNNTYSGTTTVNVGAISIYHSNALGSSVGATTVATGGTVNITATGLSIPENFTINGPGNVGGGALRNFTGANTLTGTIAVASVATILQSDSGSFLTVTGVVSGTDGLSASGKIIFTNTNTLTGTIDASGTLYFNGTNAASINNNSNLHGTGALQNVTVVATNSINPGDNGGGTLTVHNTTLSATTTLNSELRSGTSDTLSVIGTVNLASAILATDLNYNAPAGAQFTIVDNDGGDAITGAFAGKAEGAIFSTGGAFARNVQISYVGGSGNDVVLTVQSSSITTTVSSSNNPQNVGQGVTFTASTGTNVPAATGTISFYDGATLLGTGTVNGSGSTTFVTTALTVGSHNITAQYSGDSNYAGSTSAILTQVITAAGVSGGGGSTAAELASTGGMALAVMSVGFLMIVVASVLQTNILNKKRT